jgi:hypothetical protein
MTENSGGGGVGGVVVGGDGIVSQLTSPLSPSSFDEFDYAQQSERVAYILAGGVRRLCEYFVDKTTVESECTCQICQELFENPVFLPNCLHTFCRACLVQWEANQKPIDAHKPLPPNTRRRVPRATCPLCREKFLVELSDHRRSDPSCLVRPNPVMRRVIYALRIHCPLGACRWLAPLADLVPHVVNHCHFFTTRLSAMQRSSLSRSAVAPSLSARRLRRSLAPLTLTPGACAPCSRVFADDTADNNLATRNTHHAIAADDQDEDSVERDERDAIARELSAAAAALGAARLARRAVSQSTASTSTTRARRCVATSVPRSARPLVVAKQPIVLEQLCRRQRVAAPLAVQAAPRLVRGRLARQRRCAAPL